MQSQGASFYVASAGVAAQPSTDSTSDATDSSAAGEHYETSPRVAQPAAGGPTVTFNLGEGPTQDAAVPGLVGWGHGPPPVPASDSSRSDEEDDSAQPAAAAASVAVPSDPTRRYINAVVSHLAVSMPAFDGSTAALRMCPGAKVEADPAVKAPEGTEEFSQMWFGVARAIATQVIAMDTPERAELLAAQGEGGESKQPLSLTVGECRRALVGGLSSILDSVVDGGSMSSYGRYSVSRPSRSPQIGDVSRRIMEEWQQDDVLPASLQGKYAALASSPSSSASPSPASAAAVPVQSLDDLQQILLAGIDTWVASFFPMAQLVKRSGPGAVRLLWNYADSLDELDLEELRYQVYRLATLRCLLKNKDGKPRGAVVSKAWLRRFADWIMRSDDDSSDAAGVRGNEEEEGAAAAGRVCPGPISTFPCIHVARGNPAKHWLRPEDRDAVDVIPDRLFDFLTLLFGSGPKYMAFGDFTLLDGVVAALRPRPLMVEVRFRTVTVQDDGVRVEAPAIVFVENAVHRTPLSEVFRLALGLVHEEAEEEEGMMSSERLDMFTAAIYCPSTLKVAMKDYNDTFFTPPEVISGDAGYLLMSDVLQRAARRLAANGEHAGSSTERHRKDHVTLELSLLHEEDEEDEEESGGGLRSSTQAVAVTRETVLRSGVCGLTNIGNTCYMNSALQCLAAFRPFREKMLSYPVSTFPNAVITGAYIKLLADMWSGQLSYAETRALKECIGEKERRFAGFQQQDANEFIEVMLDAMEEEVNEVSGRRYRERLDSDKDIPIAELSQLFWDNFLDNNTGPIPRDFFHQSKTVFRCLTCGETSTVFDNNLTLSVNIKEPVVKKNVHTSVVVRLPAAQGGDQSLADATAHINLTVRVATDEDDLVNEADLAEAIRLALRKSHELSEKVAHACGNAAASVDYRVHVMEVPDYGRAHASAQCYLADSPASSAAERAPAAHPVNGEAAAVSEAAGLRVWYFLKDKHDNNSSSHGTLAYAEDLSAELLGESHRACAAGPAGSADGAEFEGKGNGKCVEEVSKPSLLQEGQAQEHPSRVAVHQAPISAHIIAQGKRIAEALMAAVDEPPAEGPAPSHPYAADYMMLANAPAAAAAAPVADKPARSLQLRVLHRKDRRTPPRDITEAAKATGDLWLHKWGSKGLGRGGADTVEARDAAGERAPAPMNMSVVLQYDGDYFEEDITAIGGDVRWGGGGGGGSGYGGGKRFGPVDEDESPCTLEECLRYGMEADTLRGDDSWYCPKCKEFREAVVQRSLFRLPPCFIISFKRFKMRNAYHANKNNTTVTFPAHTDFSAYLDSAAREATPPVNLHTQYRLRGVVYHSGSLSFGHYTAAVYNDRLERWVDCNDTSATVATQQYVTPSPAGAYILCYEQVQPCRKGKTRLAM